MKMMKKENEFKTFIDKDELTNIIDASTGTEKVQTIEEHPIIAESTTTTTANVTNNNEPKPIITAEMLEQPQSVPQPNMQAQVNPNPTPQVDATNITTQNNQTVITATPINTSTQTPNPTNETKETPNPTIPVQEQSTNQMHTNQPPYTTAPKQKKVNKVPFIILAVVALIVASFGSYFIFFKKDKVDIFDYMEITLTGTNNNGTITISPNYFGNEKENAAVNGLEYELLESENGRLANGEQVVIFVDKNQPILKANRLALIEEEFTLTISGLAVVPATYYDISDDSTIISKANGLVETYANLYQETLNTSSTEKFGFVVPTSIQTEHIQTWYTSNTNSQTCQTLYRTMACGSIAYVYKLHASVDSNEYYLTDPDVYLVFMYTGIHYDADDELQSDVYNNISLEQVEDLPAIEQNLAELGFAIV